MHQQKQITNAFSNESAPNTNAHQGNQTKDSFSLNCKGIQDTELYQRQKIKNTLNINDAKVVDVKLYQQGKTENISKVNDVSVPNINIHQQDKIKTDSNLNAASAPDTKMRQKHGSNANVKPNNIDTELNYTIENKFLKFNQRNQIRNTFSNKNVSDIKLYQQITSSSKAKDKRVPDTNLYQGQDKLNNTTNSPNSQNTLKIPLTQKIIVIFFGLIFLISLLSVSTLFLFKYINNLNAITTGNYKSIGNIVDSSDTSKINISVYDDLTTRLGSKTGTVDVIDGGTPIVFTMAGRDWQVVYRDPDNPDIITIWMTNPYTTADFDSSSSTYCEYEYSAIRNSLLNYFDTQVKIFNLLENIVVSPSNMTSNYKTAQDTNEYYGGYIIVFGQISTYNDKFWLPSYYETSKFWNLDRTDIGSSKYCWLRSGLSRPEMPAMLVTSGGTFNYDIVSFDYGVRPACHLSLSAMVATLSSTITLNQQGGSGGTSSVTASSGSAMPAITLPTRTGYTFGGYWTGTNGTGTQYYTASGTSARNWDKTGNVTLYAKWTANTYYIAYNGSGATGGTMSNSTHTYDTAKNLTTNAYTRTGYSFLGWSTSSTATTATYIDGQSVSNLTTTNGATVTLYAVWKINTYTISTSASPPIGGSLSGGGTYNYNTSITLIATPNADYFFDYWTVDGVLSGVTSNKLTLTVTNNTAVVAHFRLAKTYSYATTGGEVRLKGNDFQGGTSSTTATYEAIPYAGYYLIGWSVYGAVYAPSGTIYKERTLTLSKSDSQGYGVCAIFSTDANATPSPNYNLNTSTAISAQLGGEARVIGCDFASLADTDTITYIAVTDKGYKFDGWYIDGVQVSANLSQRFTKSQVYGKIVEARFSLNNASTNNDTNNTDEVL